MNWETISTCDSFLTRWLTESDFQQIMEIEEQSKYPWSEEELGIALKQQNTIRIVIVDKEKRDTVFGYVIYEIHDNRFELLKVESISEDWEYFHSTLINYLKPKLRIGTRTIINLNVPESFSGFHCLLKENGFRATKVLRNFTEEEDFYSFTFELK